MQSQFRFPRSTVLLMLVIFAGTVLTIARPAALLAPRRDRSGRHLYPLWP